MKTHRVGGTARQDGSVLVTVLVVVLVLATVILAALTVVYGKRVVSSAEEVDTLRARVGELEGELEAAAAKTAAVPLPKAPSPPVTVEVDEAKAQDVVRRVEEMGSAGAELQQRVDRLAEEKRALKEELLATSGALTQARAEANRLSRDRAGLKKDLDDASQEIREKEEALADVRALLKRSGEQSDSLQAEIKRNMEIIAGLSEKIKAGEADAAALAARLAEYPSEPLPDDQAQAKLEDALLKMKDEKDPDMRVAALFHLKVLLAGSKLEAKADGLWKKEQRVRQAAIDRAAPAVYKEVSGKVRSQPDAHEENVRLLSETLEKVGGSRYEATVRGLLEKEKKAKADADARASEASAAETTEDETAPAKTQ